MLIDICFDVNVLESLPRYSWSYVLATLSYGWSQYSCGLKDNISLYGVLKENNIHKPKVLLVIV